MESCRPTPPAMLLLCVLTRTRVTFLGNPERVETLLCIPSNGDSARATFSSVSLGARPSVLLASFSSSSMVPGSRKSFCGSSILLRSSQAENSCDLRSMPITHVLPSCPFIVSFLAFIESQPSMIDFNTDSHANHPISIPYRSLFRSRAIFVGSIVCVARYPRFLLRN